MPFIDFDTSWSYGQTWNGKPMSQSTTGSFYSNGNRFSGVEEDECWHGSWQPVVVRERERDEDDEGPGLKSAAARKWSAKWLIWFLWMESKEVCCSITIPSIKMGMNLTVCVCVFVLVTQECGFRIIIENIS